MDAEVTTCRRLDSQSVSQSQLVTPCCPPGGLRTVRGGISRSTGSAGVLGLESTDTPWTGRVLRVPYLERLAPDSQVTQILVMMSVGSKETAVWTATRWQKSLSDVCCVDMACGYSQTLKGSKMPRLQAASSGSNKALGTGQMSQPGRLAQSQL